MGLHPAFFALAVMGLAAAVLGIYSHDTAVRDGGFVFAIATIALGLLWESDALRRWRRGRAARVKVDASRVKEESGFEALADAPAPAPSAEVVRPPFGKVSQTWDSEFALARAAAPAAPEPVMVRPAPVVQATTLAVPAPVPAANGRSAPATPERLTRGMCGKCQSPITVSSRRPIRVTCPMCGHSKILQ